MSNNPAWLQSDAIETQDVTPLAPNASSTGANQGSSSGDSFGKTYSTFSSRSICNKPSIRS